MLYVSRSKGGVLTTSTSISLRELREKWVKGAESRNATVCVAVGWDDVPRDVPLCGLDNIVEDCVGGRLTGVTVLQARPRGVTGRYCVELGRKQQQQQLQPPATSGAAQQPATAQASDGASWKVRLPTGDTVTSSAATALRACRLEAVQLAAKVAAAVEGATVSLMGGREKPSPGLLTLLQRVE